MKLEDVNLIIIHASATPPSMNIGVKEIRHWHVAERGWSDIGYHFVIRRGGTVETGRPLHIMGAHVRGHNQNSIGICLVGGKGGAADDKFEDHFSAKQEQSLITLLLKLETDIRIARTVTGKAFTETLRIAGHNEFSSKGCPCFNVTKWADSAIQKRASSFDPTDTPQDASIHEKLDEILTILRAQP